MTVAQAVATLSVPDHRLMRRVNRWRAPRWVRWWMLVSTRCGDGWLWGVCGLLVLLSHQDARYMAFAAALFAVLLGIVFFRIVKKAVGRKRPCAIEPHCWATLLPPDQFSFPSGHSITAFAVASALAAFFPVLAPLLYFAACSIAASRVVLGMHFLSDVVVGAGVGFGLGTMAAVVVQVGI